MLIKRKLLRELQLHLEKKEISFIVGPRQAGKTTLMLFLKERLEKEEKKCLFFNLDIETDKQFFESQECLLRKIKLEMGSKPAFIFIDEIQRKENAGLFLKGLFDMNLPYKFIVSGSGSVELKEKIHESLVGRKRMFELGTLDFEEFVNFRTNYNYEGRLPEFFYLEKEKTSTFLAEFMNFGGYPRAVLEETKEEKRKIIGELFQSYLERDIVYLLGVQKTDDFNSLVRIMASQIGNLVNISEISNTLSIAAATVKNYLNYLEKTFILRRVSPYFRNIRKEITKSPVFYFYDLGLRNYALDIFGSVNQPFEFGFLFENLVFNILWGNIHNRSSMIHFWRTKDGAEVDFVIDLGREIIPIEVKYRNLEKPEISRSFRSFLSKYQPARALIVHLGSAMRERIERTEVDFLPFYQLFSQEFWSVF